MARALTRAVVVEAEASFLGAAVVVHDVGRIAPADLHVLERTT